MLETIFGIIRVKTNLIATDTHINLDQEKLRKCGYPGIKIIVPRVKTLKQTLLNKEIYDYKPLMFNYGFIMIPKVLSYSREALNTITLVSRVISGFVFRRPNDLLEERLSRGEEIHHKQCLLEEVKSKEVFRLLAIAKTLDVYHATENLSIGSYIVLKGYPFNGLGAEILAKQSNHIKVRLLDSDTTVSVKNDNVYYSPYDEPLDYREVCFSDLDYVPDFVDPSPEIY
ncbi:MAG: hypothetical protein RBR40_06380 [Tenuifilaceae bacterium]|nr:hypothetical protein [Tenuifilaceae bacterium]